MRKISGIAVPSAWAVYLGSVGGLTWFTLGKLGRWIPWQNEWISVVLGIFLWFCCGVAVYRLLLSLFPMKTGEIEEGTFQEFLFQGIHLPFNFFVFDPIVRFPFLPTPLSRLAYRAFGARIGENTYPGHCTIFDPLFVRLGHNVVLGHQASLIPHVLEGDRVALYSIAIEDGATVGVNAVVFGGVSIGQNSVVAAGAIVPKFTRIGPGEIWAGIPAKRIGFVAGWEPSPEKKGLATEERPADQAKKTPKSLTKTEAL